MIPDWELWACAHTLVRQYGEDAPLHAAMRADALARRSDIKGTATWRLIALRIDALQHSTETMIQ